MSKKKFDAGEIIGNLRAIEILLGKGKTAGEACRELTEQTYYRWRKEYGSMQVSLSAMGAAYPDSHVLLKISSAFR